MCEKKKLNFSFKFKMNSCKNCGNSFNSNCPGIYYCYTCFCNNAISRSHKNYTDTLKNLNFYVDCDMYLYMDVAKFVFNNSIDYDYIKSLYN